MGTSEYHGLLLGLGKADITGPIAGMRFFGFAHRAQVGNGLEQRLFARAFIAKRGDEALIWVVCDLGMVTELVRTEICERVAACFPGFCRPEAIVVSATHTHSAPGGHSAYFLYNTSVGGYCPQNRAAIVDGIVRAIGIAHDSLAPGRLELWTGELVDAGINRSLAAYERNPAAERAAASATHATEVVQLGFRDEAGALRGLLQWHGVHGTSHDKHNTLVSPDNKGHAAWLVEQHFGRGFVAGFAQANHGDVSPNRRAMDDGTFVGEGATGRDSVAIIGCRQADAALALTASAGIAVDGPLRAELCWIDFTAAVVPPELSSSGECSRTASPALGQDFMAGTEDGRGPAWFDEGDQRDTLLGIVAELVWSLDDETKALHAPKDVLISLASDERRWVPTVLPVQLLRLGPLAVATLPFEITTMAGRRIAALLRDRLHAAGVTHAIAASVANAYAGYLTTPEEYGAQHYEGASTLFGREQLGAVLGVLSGLCAAMLGQEPMCSAPAPVLAAMEPSGDELDLATVDTTLGLASFGDLAEAPSPRCRPGGEARAIFWSANPANELCSSYFDVERQQGAQWIVVATDHDWSTEVRFDSWLGRIWKCTCTWRIPADCEPGSYRFVHRGVRLSLGGTPTPFRGTSGIIEVLATAAPGPQAS